MSDKANQIRAFHFFIEKERENSTFTNDDINLAANWTGETFNSYRNKRLKGIIHRTKDGFFYVKGLIGVTENEFIEHLAQSGILKPKSQQLEDLLNEDDNKNLSEIINSGNIDLLKKLLEIALEVHDKQKLIDTLMFIFQKTHGEEREELLIALKNQNLNKNDIDIISGRKEGFEIFRKNLFEPKCWTEKDFQHFFEKNTWIFGYGLDYKFLQILQRECHVSDTDLNGKNSVITDFLLGDNKFTVIVELKRPDTPLFDKVKNRSESWCLSSDLINAVSQILTQKAEWEIKAQNEQFDENEKPIKQRTIDPKTILIIGMSEQFNDENKTAKIKAKTFELYRRNMRNIEIITYDELFDRAKFIVNQ